jgi:hypothetical protein
MPIGSLAERRRIGHPVLMESADERLSRNRHLTREIADALQQRVDGADGQWIITPDGDGVRVYLPSGYRDVVDELQRRFGDRVICEEASVRARYA